MRALLAGIFVCTVLGFYVSFIGSRFPDDQWPWWATPSIIFVFFASSVASLFLFNRRGERPGPHKTIDEQIADLESAGLLLHESFKARRAFQVEEFEDEGSHYFVELEDGRTLYLNGQYLYDFEPIEDDPEFNQPRKFPCTEFTVLRRKDAGYVVHLLCLGTVLQPECLAPHFEKADWQRGLSEDGDILAGKTYDEIKRERMKAS